MLSWWAPARGKFLRPSRWREWGGMLSSQSVSVIRRQALWEFLSADGVDVLRRLGMWTGLGGEGLPRISGVALSASDGSSWTSQLPEAGLGCSRLRLDCALMVACRDVGVQVCEGMRVVRLMATSRRISILATGADGQKEFRVKLVVAAYGKSGRLSGERGQPQRGSTRLSEQSAHGSQGAHQR